MSAPGVADVQPSSDPHGGWRCAASRPGGSVTALLHLGSGRWLAGAAGGLIAAADGTHWLAWGGPVIPGIAALAAGAGGPYVAGSAGLLALDTSARTARPLLTGAVIGVAASGGVLLAATPEDGIIRSDDEGSTWRAASAGLRSLRLGGVAAARPDAPVALAAADDGVYRSETAVGVWRRVHPWVAGIDSVALTPDGRHGLAVGSDGTVHATIDEGHSWAVVPVPGRVTAATFQPTDDGSMVVGVAGRLISLAPDGRIDRPPAGAGAEVLTLVALPDGSVMAGLHRAGIVRWHDTVRPLDVEGARLVAHARVFAIPGRPAPWIVTAGIDDAVAVSRDGGATWERDVVDPETGVAAFDAARGSGSFGVVNVDGDVASGNLFDRVTGERAGYSVPGGEVLAIAIDDTQQAAGGGDTTVLAICSGGRLVALTRDAPPNEVLRLTGDGDLLAVAADASGLTPGWAAAMRVRTAAGDWAGTIWASRDRGATWTLVIELPDPPATPPILEVSDGYVVVGWGATVRGAPVPGAPDGAARATPFAIGPTGTITALASAIIGGRRFIAAGTDQGVTVVQPGEADAVLFRSDHRGPGPTLAVGLIACDDHLVDVWAVDLHGQAWHRELKERAE